MQPSHKQLLRLRRTLLASSASLMHLLLCWLAFAAGFMQLSLHGMFLLSFVVLASCAGFLLMIWLNFNLHFRDPSLTLPQMCWGIGVIFISAYFADGLRSLFLMMVLLVLIFGAFRLEFGGFVRVGLFSTLCYALLIVALYRRGAPIEVRHEMIYAMEFFVLLIGVSILGIEMSSLRQKLQGRNRDLHQALDRIQQLAITDELTGLYNRRYIKEVLSQQKALADRGDYGFVLCLADIDYFKRVNDRYGHAGGDAVLRQLAQLLEQAVRDVDFVARLGGEEFLLVLSRTDEAGAVAMLERLRRRLTEVQWEQCPALRLTLSIGISAYRPGETWEDCLQRVDSALYQAKHDGRDQLVLL
jgi:diguanylate cyclase (GGDEF)-like protein